MTKQDGIMLRMAEDLLWRDWNYGFVQGKSHQWDEQPDIVKERYRRDARFLLQPLHSRGVVIKVDRALPFTDSDGTCIAEINALKILLDAGYVAVEPQIK